MWRTVNADTGNPVVRFDCLFCLMMLLAMSTSSYGDETGFLLEWSPPNQPPLETGEMEKRCTSVLQSLPPNEQEKRGGILFRRALLRLELNKNADAAEDIVQAARLCPDDLDVHFHKARLSELRAGNVDEAMKSAESMIAKFPNGYQGYFLKAECELFQKRNAFAIKSLDQAKQLAPDSVEVRLRRGVVNANLGRWSAMVEDMDEVLRLPPCFESYDASMNGFRGLGSYGLGEYGMAATSLSRSISVKRRLSRPVDENFHVALWYSYIKLGKPASALWAAAELKREHPKLGLSYSIWALGEAENREIDEALISAKKGVELAPKHRFPNIALGKIHLARGEYEEGLTSLLRGLRQAETGRIDIDAALHIAYVKSVAPDQRLRDGTEAVRLVEMAMTSVEPGFHSSVSLIRACATAEKGDFESAGRFIDEYISRKDLDERSRNVAEGIKGRIKAKKAFHVGDLPNAVGIPIPILVRLNGNVYCE
jgi:tetratricopeptide (TPR) repeat protein